MSALGRVFSNDFGLISNGLAGGGLVPSNFSEGVSYVWILSHSTPQAKIDRGQWQDGENWTDANNWYD